MSSPVAPGPATTTPDAPSAALCPDCGSALTADPRFVRWCRSCTWNAYPLASTATTRRDRFDRRLNRAAEARLFQRITEAGAAGLRPVRDASWVAATALASLVHLVTLAIALSGVLMIALDLHHQGLVILGALLVLAAVGLRPRLGTMRRVRRRAVHLEREEAPALYALTDRIAAALGTAPVQLIRVSGRHNASYTRMGLHRQPVLTLGLPLWETLSPQQQVALLGHELGHGANGDTSHGLWVGSALDCLARWYDLLVPGRHNPAAGRSRGAGASGLVLIGELLARIVLFVFAESVLLLHRLLRRTTVLSARRGEYLADAMAARVAGGAATAELLQQLTLGNAVVQVRQQRRLHGAGIPRRRGQAAPVLPPRADFWTELRTYTDSIPESERARRLVVSELDDSATDSTHPPTHLRLSFVRLQSHPEPLVVPSAAELAAIDAELAPVRSEIAALLETAR